MNTHTHTHKCHAHTHTSNLQSGDIYILSVNTASDSPFGQNVAFSLHLIASFNGKGLVDEEMCVWSGSQTAWGTGDVCVE